MSFIEWLYRYHDKPYTKARQHSSCDITALETSQVCRRDKNWPPIKWIHMTTVHQVSFRLHQFHFHNNFQKEVLGMHMHIRIIEKITYAEGLDWWEFGCLESIIGFQCCQQLQAKDSVCLRPQAKNIYRHKINEEVSKTLSCTVEGKLWIMWHAWRDDMSPIVADTC